MTTLSGTVVVSETARPTFRGTWAAPFVTVSDSRVYFTDGPEVRWVDFQGRQGAAPRLGLGPLDQLAIAVSPDDSRLAVTVLSYRSIAQPNPLQPPFEFAGARLLVERPDGSGANEIFSSATSVEYAVGWAAGSLVVALGPQYCCQSNPTNNSYAATSYHVVDGTTGRRLAAVCEAPLKPYGPPTQYGSLCASPAGSGPLVVEDWGGRQTAVAAGTKPDPYGLEAISPDGKLIAIGSSPVRVVDLASGAVLESLPLAAQSITWLDDGDLGLWDQSGKLVSVNLRSALDGLDHAVASLPNQVVAGTSPPVLR